MGWAGASGIAWISSTQNAQDGDLVWSPKANVPDHALNFACTMNALLFSEMK